MLALQAFLVWIHDTTDQGAALSVVSCPHPFLVGGPKGERGADYVINHLGLLYIYVINHLVQALANSKLILNSSEA